jgi:hypothetical protein
VRRWVVLVQDERGWRRFVVEAETAEEAHAAVVALLWRRVREGRCIR